MAELLLLPLLVTQSSKFQLLLLYSYSYCGNSNFVVTFPLKLFSLTFDNLVHELKKKSKFNCKMQIKLNLGKIEG